LSAMVAWLDGEGAWPDIGRFASVESAPELARS